VAVNGRVVTEMGTKVVPGRDRITFDGQAIQEAEQHIYLLLNKPVGYVSTVADPQGRPIVTDLLPEMGRRIYPVGRLDLDSEGALLMTNDGPLTNRILHPRYGVAKTYRILLARQPGQKKLRLLERGIVLEGVKTLPARIRILRNRKDGIWLEVILHEGKKRQIRKMFAAIGHPVLRLKRTAYGDLTLGRLGPGEHRFLAKKDLQKIFSKKFPLQSKTYLIKSQ
jgi:23S rRNA pseudouridine2605 synthase